MHRALPGALRLVRRTPLLLPGALALLASWLPAQTPPGGWPVTRLLDQEIRWSDGLRTRIDVRHPSSGRPTAGWPIVACFHGSGHDRKAIGATAEFLASRGYFTFAFDIRGFGATTVLNPGAFDMAPERRLLDGAEAFHLVETRFAALIDTARRGAVGRSLGGLVSTELAAYSNRPLPRPGLVGTGPRLRAIATEIWSLDRIGARVAPAGDLMSSRYLYDLSRLAPTSTRYADALAGDWHLVRASLLVDPMENLLPRLQSNGVALFVQAGHDDSYFAARYAMDALPAMSVPYKGLVDANGHGMPGNEVCGLLRRDTQLRWLDHHLKGIQNGVDLESTFEVSMTPLPVPIYQQTRAQLAQRFVASWPVATPLRDFWLHGSGTISAQRPMAPQPNLVISHQPRPGYDVAAYIADGAGARPADVIKNIPYVEHEFAGDILQQEIELLGRPELIVPLQPDAPHYQISASLWARQTGRPDRYLSSGTFGRRVTTTAPQLATIEMRDVAFVIPAGYRIVVKLHNLSRETSPGQDRIAYVPDLGRVRMEIPFQPTSAPWLRLPVRAERGLDLTPRIAEASASIPIAAPLEIDGGPERAGQPYVIWMGGSGIGPGIVLGSRLWLNPDAFTNFGISVLGTPVLPGFVGLLDTQGQASARLQLPAWPGLAGLRLSFVAQELTGTFTASAAAQFDLVP